MTERIYLNDAKGIGFNALSEKYDAIIIKLPKDHEGGEGRKFFRGAGADQIVVLNNRILDLESKPESTRGVRGLQLDIIYSRSGKEVEDLDPDTLRVFGDNLDRAGKGGQAVIRDQRNTFGIATKRAPRRDEAAYFSDKPDEIEAVEADIARLLATGKEFVIPEGGLGTGLAQLKNRSPKIAKIIDEFMEKYVSKDPKQESFDFKEGSLVINKSLLDR